MSMFDNIEELLAGGESFALAVIVSRKGSAPRDVGTRMLVRKDASIVGTIGGGLLEAQVRVLAMEVLASRESVVKKYSFTADDAAEMCMICGGVVEVLVHFVDASQSSNLVFYQQINAALRSQKRAWLITEIPSGGKQSGPPAQCLVKRDGTHVGQIDSDVVQALLHSLGSAEVMEHEEDLFFVEPLGHEGTVLIFGAGHVSQKLAPLTRMVGFRTVVMDDRKEFANRERFETADELIVLSSFDWAMKDLEIGEDSYLVIVTRGHAHDRTVLRQALHTDAKYIGMIGSRRKRNQLYEGLSREGFSRSELDEVHSPIGLDIGAETPEEIAVSIVAELIKVRAEKNR